MASPPTGMVMTQLRRHGAPPLRFKGSRTTVRHLSFGPYHLRLELWERRKGDYAVAIHEARPEGTADHAMVVPSLEDLATALDAWAAPQSSKTKPRNRRSRRVPAASLAHEIWDRANIARRRTLMRELVGDLLADAANTSLGPTTTNVSGGHSPHS